MRWGGPTTTTTTKLHFYLATRIHVVEDPDNVALERVRHQ